MLLKAGVDVSSLIKVISLIESKAIDLVLIGVNPAHALQEAFRIVNARKEFGRVVKGGG